MQWADGEPVGVEEVLDLWSAKTADALHQVLVLYEPMRGTSDAFEPFELLAKHHETEPECSLDTALLLVTDRRWRGGAGRLVRRIAECGILDSDQLDELARCLLTADDALLWPVPDEWFAGGIVIDLEDMQVVEDPPADEMPTGTVARREVWTTVRRWAAGHLLVRHPGAWHELLQHAEQLPPPDGAAAMTGLLDRIDVVPPDAQAVLVDRATVWPQQDVRRLAFELVARRDGPDAGYRLASRDPRAQVRSWAERARKARAAAVQPDAAAPGVTRSRGNDDGQPTLF